MARASFGALVAVIALAGCQTLAAPSPSVPVAYEAQHGRRHDRS